MKTLTAKKVNGKWEIEAEKLESALIEGQLKARERKLSAADINKIINVLDQDLAKKGVLRKNLVGVQAVINHLAQHFPNCYNGTPESTFIRVEYNKSGHPAVTNIYRTRCGNKWADVHFTDDAKNDIVTAASVIN